MVMSAKIRLNTPKPKASSPQKRSSFFESSCKFSPKNPPQFGVDATPREGSWASGHHAMHHWAAVFHLVTRKGKRKILRDI